MVQRDLLDQLEQVAPAAVRNVVPKPVSVPLLRDILRRLVEEGISIRDLQAVLEALSGLAVTEKDPLVLAEFVRTQLAPAITFRLTQGQPSLQLIMVDPMIQKSIEGAIAKTKDGAFLALSPAVACDILQVVTKTLASLPPGAPHVFMTMNTVRRHFWSLIHPEHPEATVICPADVLKSMPVAVLASVSPDAR
jgi:type III secretory pathway component EscV